MKTILDFSRAKRDHAPIVMVTAYDAAMARIVAASDVDAILVGDSVAMVVHGCASTIDATLPMMELHTASVRRGAPAALIVADLPFGTFRRGAAVATEAAERLVRAGASAVKLEGVRGHEDVVRHLVEGGIPVMGHLGLTPQSHLQLSGYRVQGKSDSAAQQLLVDAETLAALGAFATVLECVPAQVATEVTQALTIPTIGIGAGTGTDGQILVLSDLLGLDDRFRPKFARRYLDGHTEILRALNHYARDVRAAHFPAAAETLA